MKKTKIFISLFLFALISIIGINNAKAEEVKLKSFSLKTKELFQKEKIYYDIQYEGKVSFIGIWAKEINTNDIFYTSTQNIKDGYFDLSEQNGNTHNGIGTYELTGITLGKEKGIVYYSANGCNGAESSDCINYDFKNTQFTIKEKNNQPESNNIGIFDYVMTMNYQQVFVGEKVQVNFGSPESFEGKEIKEKPLSNVMLSFINQNTNDILNVYLKSLDNNPYFIVPTTATPGKYVINYGYLTFTDGTSEKYKNRADKIFSYEGTFEIKEKEFNKESYTFNSENYNAAVKNDLEKLNNNAIITINANNSPIIYKELFDEIKETDKTLIIDYQNMRWVFNGKDIINPKTIEVSAKIEELPKKIKNGLNNNITSKSLLLEFSNNGELPGKTLIKLEGKDIDKYLNSETIYVYYYDENKNDISKVAMEIQKNNGFYEFYINHNSKYIITDQKIEENKIDEKTKEIKKEKAQKKNTAFNYIIIGSLFSLIAIIISILIIIKNKRK